MAASYDVLVIGGGHAGAEAAWAAARLGARTALVTFERAAIGRMSCNPAIGGIGKGQMVREIDALGGLMGLVTDEAGIQFRMLNRSKGPAVWAPRAQCDRELYAAVVQRRLAECPNLAILEAAVEDLLCETRAGARTRVTGVRLRDGATVAAGAVVVTSGTFLRALMHTGEQITPGGRIGEPAAEGLSAALLRLGLRLGRLKTGTPPRLARDSINYSRLEEQHGDSPPAPFSMLSDAVTSEQVSCWIGFTNEAIHGCIRANLHRAPMYSGQIRSSGPRYCPSIEDKVVRFADKSRHQLFLEPEGRNSDRIYVNGISTSLPAEVQARIVARIDGLEHARVLQWGYAVEYDFSPPEQIDATLMTKCAEGLFLAGQINGTSGYEEAAAQGLLAGVNAVRFVRGASPVVLQRDEAYIGVMIDDLVTQSLLEPYRMFTSRAENRLHLRFDNAAARLTPIGRSLGLVCDARWDRFERVESSVAELEALFASLKLDGRSLAELLRRPEEDGARFVEAHAVLLRYQAMPDVWGRAVVAAKYAGYLEQQRRSIEYQRSMEAREIPSGFDFATVRQLRREAVERLSAVRPRNIGQAARVSGVHPTDVTLLLVAIRERASKNESNSP